MTYENIITYSIGILAIIGAVWIPLQIARRSKFNPAATEFVAAFSVAIRALKDGESDTYILQDQFPIHEKAMRKFILNLSGGKERRFREAWQRYENHCNKRTGDDAIMQHGLAVLFDPNIGTTELNKHVITLIDELLTFAKHKK
jgi:hypothetical protein